MFINAVTSGSTSDLAWADFAADIPVAQTRIVTTYAGAWAFTRLKDGSVVRTAVHDQLSIHIKT
jgi:hypothetical protein